MGTRGVAGLSATGEVSHALRGVGFDASEDGTGRGTLVVAAPLTVAMGRRVGVPDGGDTTGHLHVSARAAALRGRQGGDTAELGGDVANALRASSGGGDKPHVIAFDPTQITSKTNRSRPVPGDPAPPITSQGKASLITGAMVSSGEPIARPVLTGEASLDTETSTIFAFHARQDCMSEAAITPPLDRDMNTVGVRVQYGVRRLMPVECARLQGFPDGWTRIPYRGKLAADSPRYAAIGNSWPVPVAAWIGQRLDTHMTTASSHPYALPILKWAGGKRRLLATIEPFLNWTDEKPLVEPFGGGAALTLAGRRWSAKLVRRAGADAGMPGLDDDLLDLTFGNLPDLD